MYSIPAGHAASGSAALIVFAVIVGWLTVGLIPMVIAWLYRLPGKSRIAVLSLLLGWTGVAWLAALAITVVAAGQLTWRTAVPVQVQAVPPYPQGWGPRR